MPQTQDYACRGDTGDTHGHVTSEHCRNSCCNVFSSPPGTLLDIVVARQVEENNLRFISLFEEGMEEGLYFNNLSLLLLFL